MKYLIRRYSREQSQARQQRHRAAAAAANLRVIEEAAEFVIYALGRIP